MISKNFQNITATEWIERLKLGEFAVSDFINYSLFSIKKRNKKAVDRTTQVRPQQNIKVLSHIRWTGRTS